MTAAGIDQESIFGEAPLKGKEKRFDVANSSKNDQRSTNAMPIRAVGP